MNIHGALAGPPPFHSKPPPSLSRYSGPFPDPSWPPSDPPPPPLVPLPTSTCAPRGLVPIYHPLRYPSNGHQSKAEITIRVCPVDEVDGGVDGKANRTRERKRKGGAQAAGKRVRGPSEWLAAGARPVVIAFELEITFRTAKCRFSPPVLTALRRVGARTCSILSHLPAPSSTRVKRKIFEMLFGAHITEGEKESDNEAEPATSHPLEAEVEGVYECKALFRNQPFRSSDGREYFAGTRMI